VPAINVPAFERFVCISFSFLDFNFPKGGTLRATRPIIILYAKAALT